MNEFSIPSPCSEDWDAMTPAGRGRHCASCENIVVDLSAMTREMALKTLASNDGSMSGNVLVDREGYALFREEPVARRRLPVLSTRAVLAAAAIAALSACAAPEVDPPTPTNVPAQLPIAPSDGVVQPSVTVTPVQAVVTPPVPQHPDFVRMGGAIALPRPQPVQPVQPVQQPVGSTVIRVRPAGQLGARPQSAVRGDLAFKK